MSNLNENNMVNNENDIMAEPDKKKSILGSTKKSKIINITALVILLGVVVWCALYQTGIIGAI